MNTVLVTGGAGFIGSHLCERLIERGERVVCYDNFDPFYALERKERNISFLRKQPRFALVQNTILNRDALIHTIKEFRVGRIVHLAARAGVRPSLEDPTFYQEVNVCGTTNVLEAARKCGIGSLVLASSSSVYGANNKVPFEETDPVEMPISPYAASKRACELAAYVHCHLYGMDVLCHRFFTVYGPRQRPDMAISQFVRKVRCDEPVDLYGDGTSRRDYTYVDDIVSGIVASVDRAPGLGFQIFNLGNSHTVQLRELIESVGQAVGRRPHVRHRAERAGDVKVTYACNVKAKKLLGYVPKTSLQEGLCRYVAWLEEEDRAHVAA